MYKLQIGNFDISISLYYNGQGDFIKELRSSHRLSLEYGNKFTIFQDTIYKPTECWSFIESIYTDKKRPAKLQVVKVEVAGVERKNDSFFVAVESH